MSASALSFEAPRPVARKVSRLRTLVRLYVLLEGFAAVAIVAGLAFWLGLAVDWTLEPSPVVRAAMWAAAAAAIAVAAWRYLGRRVFASLPSDSLALLVERRYPQLQESLVTTVGAARDAHGGAVRRELIDATARRAVDAVRDVDLRRVFDFRPLARKVLTAVALGLAVVALAALVPEAFGFWLQRMRLDARPWPRLVELTVVGFDRDGETVNVARNDDFELEVLASIVDGHAAPAEVEVRWRRSSDGVRGRGPMLRIGEAVPGRDRAQSYRYTFKVSADLEFDVIGGDDRVRNLRLRAVQRPAATRVSLDCTYPDYMRRPPRTIRAGARAELPEGASAACRIEANKPLKKVDVRDSAEQTQVPATVAAERPNEFSFPIAAAGSDRVFLITMHDADGVENREPFRLAVSVVPDKPPEAEVRLRGIGSAITPRARIPLAGSLTDDYGLEEAWIEYEIDQTGAERRPFAAQPAGMASLKMTEPFDLADADPETKRPRVELAPGQHLTLSVKARDAYDLGDEPHVGSSGRFRLDVVTPSQLRALLERRELGLRRRFEAIYEKMVGVQDLVHRIDLAPPEADADDDRTRDDRRQPVEDSAAARRDLGRIGGAGQNATQLAFETTGVAEGFDNILAELVNNRVDTEELKVRLEQGISEPLKEIGGVALPRLKERLAELETAFAADRAGAARPLSAATAEADEIVAAMKRVLDRMLELESYNELVELLRGIVGEHAEQKERMQDQQRRRLRSLFDE